MDGVRSSDYRHVTIEHAELRKDETEAVKKLQRAIELREKWLYQRITPEFLASKNCLEYNPFLLEPFDSSKSSFAAASKHSFQWIDGIVRIFSCDCDEIKNNQETKSILYHSKSMKEFADDITELLTTVNDPNTRSFSYSRLILLERRFSLYVQLNEEKERLEQKRCPHRDFYNVRKVDTHVHHSSFMNQKVLLNFMKNKLRHYSEDRVTVSKDSKKEFLTLKQVFEKLKMTPEDLNVDILDVHADSTLFKRFDRFNLKYNPVGEPVLREIFLKTDNFIKGRYLAEITKEVIAGIEDAKYQNSEPRISIYGRNINEWEKLSTWFVDHNIYNRKVRWLIQIPRLYNVYKKAGLVESFGAMLRNLFDPLFKITIDPMSNPKLHMMLKKVVGFDSVDDESKYDMATRNASSRRPEDWTNEDNPPYIYYQFYIQANLAVLNKLREEKGMNTFCYRPHSGEAGDIIHLACSFLLADGIAHGLELRKSSTLQYLYYLTQIGIAMSPMSNNALFLGIMKNPFYSFFRRGLNVSLSTDDPLQFQITRDPLMEEYSVAKVVWKLSKTDVCELARNSVLQSGFEPYMKEEWLGKTWFQPGPTGNDIMKTNVPSIRLQYRYDTLCGELCLVYDGNIPRHIKCLPSRSIKENVRTEELEGKQCKSN